MTEIELSSSWLHPKLVSLSPFPEPEHQRISQGTLFSCTRHYLMCVKRSLNTRIVGFGDCTLLQCTTEVKDCMKASRLFSDQEAMEKVSRAQRNVVDTSILPWSSKPEYVNWLEVNGRIP